MVTLGSIALVLTLAVPLAMAVLAVLVARPLRLLAWAAVPGVLAALIAPHGHEVGLPYFVLGANLGVDRIGAVFLAITALLWLLAGAYAARYMADSPRPREFSALWLVTLAGTLGTFIAADVVTFYVAFSLMSLAAYGLVVHDRNAGAWRAGRIYIVLAVLAEAALLAAFMVAATHAPSIALADVQAGLASSPWRGYAVAGLVVGFGVKAGLVPLHVWLPLAHGQAPTPASAVLSGAIVKAGIIGLIRFLPADGSAVGDTLVVVGLVTAYYGALVGLAQTSAKPVLAYSTLSQMGLVVSLLGAALGQPQTGAALDAITLYAAHHGLAKGALFLAIGVVAASGGRSLRIAMAAVAIMALAIAGLPLTGGALAKLAVKDIAGHGIVALLVTASAVFTALLMIRFLALVASEAGAGTDRPPLGLVLPWAAATVAAVVIPWVLFPALTDHPPGYALAPAELWSGLWPIVLAGAAAALAARLWPAAPVTLPPGDLVVIAEAALAAVRTRVRAVASALQSLTRPHPAIVIPEHAGAIAERTFERWSVIGPILVVLGALLAVTLAWPA